jgi:hypothetical protein
MTESDFVQFVTSRLMDDRVGCVRLFGRSRRNARLMWRLHVSQQQMHAARLRVPRATLCVAMSDVKCLMHLSDCISLDQAFVSGSISGFRTLISFLYQRDTNKLQNGNTLISHWYLAFVCCGISDFRISIFFSYASEILTNCGTNISCMPLDLCLRTWWYQQLSYIEFILVLTR